jgi:RNA polymerase sigma-70 factor (ECF subfamily)
MVLAKAQATSAANTEIEAAARSGDRTRTLTLLMERYGEGVYRYAFGMTHDPHQAEDIRQQVFVEAYRDLGSVLEPSALPLWLFGIARHRCLDAISARQRWAQRFKNEPPDEPELVDPQLDRELDRQMQARVLARCLAKLAPAARDAVVLRYQQDLTYEEAAALAGDAAGTLQRRVARALPVLRRCMRANLPGGLL